MTRSPLPLLLAVLLPLSSRADQRHGCGTVDALEVTSLTRTRVTAFLRTSLPDTAEGGRQKFAGEIAVANTALPIAPSLTAMVQQGPSGNAVVLLVDLELAKIPQALLTRVHPLALDVTLNGSLAGGAGAPVPVCAAGVLKVGTPDVRTSAPIGASLAGFSGARFTGFSLTEVEGQATATFFNPLSFPLDVKDLVYSVWAGDRKVAEGERHGVRLHPGRENAVELPITAPNADLLSALGGAMASGGRVAGRLVARVSLRVGKDQVLTVPLDLPGSIQVIR
ncbi:MAG TPA: LEA type 2 family protein [Thermoanaerobaculia bacterium]|nr:LEA type 2 family protein [Thermoanaerobaculia bacterium]